MSLDEYLKQHAETQFFESCEDAADAPGISVENVSGVAVVVGKLDELDQTALMVQHGLDPDEWEVTNCKINRWSGQRPKDRGLIQHRQLTLTLRRRRQYELILPAPFEQTYAVPAARPLTDKPRLILVTTDMQIPFHDEDLHQLSCYFAHDNQVDEWLDLGDFLDLPMLSKWREKPQWRTTLNESVQTGSRILYERAQAAPAWCVKTKLDGNHDARMDTFLLDHTKPLYGLQRAAIGPEEHEGVLSLDYLMRAAERGWRSHNEYPYNEIEVAPGLLAYHGNSVRSGAGNTVRRELEQRSHSLLMGHVNNLAAVSLTRSLGRQESFTTYGYECGLMCLREGSLGFGSPTKDWSPGFATVTVWPDGAWSVELAPYINGEVRWRDQAWRIRR